MSPSALRPELTERFFAAMQAASAEQAGDELERRLRRLRPAPVNEARQQLWFMSMARAAAASSSRSSRARFFHWEAAAAIALFCTLGCFFVMNGSATTKEPSGLACRSLMEAQADGALEWREGRTALRRCDVLYEDSFVLDGDEGCTITVRVPVRTHLLIEEEVI